MSTQNDRCGQCGAHLASNQTSIFEMAAGMVCGSLVLAILILGGYSVHQWLEHEEHRFLDFPAWYERLDFRENLGNCDTGESNSKRPHVIELSCHSLPYRIFCKRHNSHLVGKG